MYLECFDEVKDITKELVSIPSIVKTSGESDVANWIYNYYENLNYYKENPKYLRLQLTEDDGIKRHNAIAMVKGTKGIQIEL